MKRKRSNKKGKSKKRQLMSANEVVPDVIGITTEENTGLNDLHNDAFEPGTEAETPSSMGNNLPEKVATVNSSRLVYGRVKVKIKTSKTLDSQHTSSDPPTQSDTDKSSQKIGLEKQVVANEKVEDSANSLPEHNLVFPDNATKKNGSIKIKASGALSWPSMTPCSNAGVVKNEKVCQKEPELLHRDHRYSEHELNAALEVIKKIMKMDAADPFNVPVNPVALKIPDYFDVIDTPMDFGTICRNLENRIKYRNSGDVYKDVQCIWNNCHKYNNKGDFILELMKRVKKNFSKYWTAAGLYAEQPQGVNGVGGIQTKDVNTSSHGKMHGKGGHSKFKTRKRNGVKRHKEDCSCAICIMMRRRQRREGHIEPSEIHPAPDVNTEVMSPVGSPFGEDISSNMENSPCPNADAGLEEKEGPMLEGTEQIYSPLLEKLEDEKENEMTTPGKEEDEISEQSQSTDKSGEDHDRQHQTLTIQRGDEFQNYSENEGLSLQHEDAVAAEMQDKHKESLDKNQKAKIYENLRHLENPKLLQLCGSLFSESRKSIWSGPHSLGKRQQLATRCSPIHAAVATFMK